MKSTPTRYSLAAVVIWMLPAAVVHGQQARTGWTDYLGGPDSSHYSPLTQITPANVNKLEIAWTYEAGEGGTLQFLPACGRKRSLRGG